MFGIGNESPNYEDSLSRIARINLFRVASNSHVEPRKDITLAWVIKTFNTTATH